MIVTICELLELMQAARARAGERLSLRLEDDGSGAIVLHNTILRFETRTFRDVPHLVARLHEAIGEPAGKAVNDGKN